VLSEIQGLWLCFPATCTAVVFAAPITEFARSSRTVSRDMTPNIDQMLESAALDVSAEEHNTGLDDRNLAFTAVFLHHVAPALEAVYMSMRAARPAVGRSRAVASVGHKKVKRQAPSVMTPETIALREALTQPAASPAAPFAAAVGIGVTSDGAARSDTVPVGVATTPSKARRSPSAGSAADSVTARPTKSPRGKPPPTAGSINSTSEFPEESYRSPSKPRTARAPSFEAISPGFAAAAGMSPRSTGEARYRPPSSTSNSITTSGRTSPSVTLFGGRAQRSYSDLNVSSSYLSRQPSTSSPVKGGGMSFSLSPQKMGEFGAATSDYADAMERLVIIAT
jgi:hypothetical protein